MWQEISILEKSLPQARLCQAGFRRIKAVGLGQEAGAMHWRKKTVARTTGIVRPEIGIIIVIVMN